MSLRITGGRWRSRRLHRPDTKATRPMPDKVKQAIFNILGNHYGLPGTLPPLRVADVFAGSGSMGLEALSRGCRSCVFYESDRIALQSLRENISGLQAEECTHIRSGNAWRQAATDSSRGSFDVIFLDPPYRESQRSDAESPVGRFLDRISETALVNKIPVPLVVLHHSSRVSYLTIDVAAPWTVWDERRLGSSGVTFFLDRTGLAAASDEKEDAS